MKFSVSVPFTVSFLDLDNPKSERGLLTISKRCAGTVEAEDAEEAIEIAKRRILAEYPVCWSRRFGKGHAEPVQL